MNFDFLALFVRVVAQIIYLGRDRECPAFFFSPALSPCARGIGSDRGTVFEPDP
jgi:hypothetical protein